MTSYEILKTLHIVTVFISGTLFAYRVYLRLFSVLPSTGWPRILPHVNDSLLLALAISMLVLANIDVMTHGWIQAKIVALVIYIFLGIWSLRANTRIQCGVRAIPAVLVFGYIVGVALTKSVFPPSFI